VLEALSGYLGDVNGFLESVAAAQRIAIAEREISLEGPAGTGGAPSTPVPNRAGGETGAAAGPSMSRM